MSDDFRILVPLDGSTEAESALPLSAPLALALGFLYSGFMSYVC